MPRLLRAFSNIKASDFAMISREIDVRQRNCHRRSIILDRQSFLAWLLTPEMKPWSEKVNR